MSASLVGSEMCIRDRISTEVTYVQTCKRYPATSATCPRTGAAPNRTGAPGAQARIRHGSARAGPCA
eukprot:10567406-Alexandrium_andersonii.AAC.1